MSTLASTVYPERSQGASLQQWTRRDHKAQVSSSGPREITRRESPAVDPKRSQGASLQQWTQRDHKARVPSSGWAQRIARPQQFCTKPESTFLFQLTPESTLRLIQFSPARRHPEGFHPPPPPEGRGLETRSSPAIQPPGGTTADTAPAAEERDGVKGQEDHQGEREDLPGGSGARGFAPLCPSPPLPPRGEVGVRDHRGAESQKQWTGVMTHGCCNPFDPLRS